MGIFYNLIRFDFCKTLFHFNSLLSSKYLVSHAFYNYLLILLEHVILIGSAENNKSICVYYYNALPLKPYSHGMRMLLQLC